MTHLRRLIAFAFTGIALVAVFGGLAVMAGLVAPEDLPFWPEREAACLVTPKFDVTEVAGTYAIAIRTGGELDAQDLHDRLATAGHEISVRFVTASDDLVNHVVDHEAERPDSSADQSASEVRSNRFNVDPTWFGDTITLVVGCAPEAGVEPDVTEVDRT